MNANNSISTKVVKSDQRWSYVRARRNALFFLLMCMLASVMCSSGLAEPVTQPTARTPRNEWARRVQSVFGVSPSGVDILGPLAEALGKFASESASGSTQSLDKLVDALLAGSDPDALSAALITATEISDAPVKPDHDGPLGNGMRRRQLSEFLWVRAQAVHDSDPSKAKRYSRAALLLAAQEDFIFGPFEIILITRRLDDFSSIADLSKSQAAALLQIIQDLKKVGAVEADKQVTALEALDVLVADPNGSMPADHVTAFIGKLNDWQQAMQDDPASQYDVVFVAWESRNLARERNVNAALQSIDNYLKDLAQKTGDDNVKRWISEAMTAQGRAPAGPSVHYSNG